MSRLVTTAQHTFHGSPCINKFVYYTLIHFEHTTPLYLCKLLEHVFVLVAGLFCTFPWPTIMAGKCGL